jgi:Alginate export
MMKKETLLAASCLSILAAGQAFAEDKPPSNDGPIIEAIKSGKPLIDVRYRFEAKNQDGFAEDAYANTLRTRFGYESGEIFNLKFLVEFENVTTLGDDQFNSTTNGRTMFPVIADPNATEINRAQVTFTGIDKTAITVGRQRFNLNNQRFVGAVDFRQNQQTFDAARFSSKLIDRVTLDYLYISRVHRIFGDNNPSGEFNSDSHVISVIADGGNFGTLKGYGIILDLEEAPALSSQSWGARYENTVTLDKDVGVKLGVVAEYATQSDYAANMSDYREDYIHGEVSLGVAPFTGTVGYEKLGGNGVSSFSTPLATLHKFQGFADVFLVTPAAGLQDTYGTIAFQWKDSPFGTSVKLFATYHDFKSDVGSFDLGNEVDAGFSVRFNKHWSVNVKGAIYDGGASSIADRNLLWTALRFQY